MPLRPLYRHAILSPIGSYRALVVAIHDSFEAAKAAVRRTTGRKRTVIVTVPASVRAGSTRRYDWRVAA